uniref:Coiled-coil domain containing 78 n=1 Tax=Cyclopterus lumpus TaxID=8103 RepID=A0A8C2XRS4_CYCLU
MATLLVDTVRLLLKATVDKRCVFTSLQLQLREQNERLSTKVGYLESRLGHLAGSNTDLSCRLVQSEEGKLKLSKELVEEKIQTNKMREQFEEETFELKNKILNQASVLTQLEMKRDRLFRELQSAEALLKMGEKSGQDLTEEHAALKKNYLALAEAHEEELAQSEKLSTELLTLAQAQDALRRRLEEQQQSVKTSTQDLHGELDRVRVLIGRMSRNRVKVIRLQHAEENKLTIGSYALTKLLGNQDEIKDMLEKMKSSYEEQQRKLEEKALMCSQSQVKEVEEENSKLQLQVKELNEEYRARLVCYLRDLAVSCSASETRAHVDSMLQDVRSSYRVREQQLAYAARSYKKRLQKLTKTHEALLIAYRVQRDQILAQMECGLDPGPPESSFSLEPTELRDEPEKELHHLRQDKARLECQLQAARKQVAQKKDGCFEVSCSAFVLSGVCLPACKESWSDMKKQLREITDSTLKERALLLTRATVAEAQVWELQDFVDNHLERRPGAHKVHILHSIKKNVHEF